MDFVIGSQLTNVRPEKSMEAEVITTPTTGNLRLTNSTAERLGVKAGDYLGVQTATVDGQPVCTIFKGGKGKDDVVVGSKLASPNEKGAALQCSAAAAWQALGGNKEESKHFSVAEEPVRKLHPGLGVEVDFYILKFETKVPKTERKAKEEVKDVVPA